MPDVVASQNDAIADLELVVVNLERGSGEGANCGGVLSGEGVEGSRFGAGAGKEVCVRP